MYLKVGNFIRPFNEARAAIRYTPRYDVKRRLVEIEEVWEISGRIVLQTNATQSRMTQALQLLDRDFGQYRPDLVFLEDDGVTESFLQLKRGDCIDGPYVGSSGLPSDGADIYATGVSYQVTMVGVKSIVGAGSNVVLEFTEQVSQLSGGRIEGHVGGAINLAERQVFRQFEPYRYVQSGRAVGLYGYVQPPPPIWPGAQTRRNQPVKVSPRVIGPVRNREYEISWSYEFEHVFPLFGDPHEII